MRSSSPLSPPDDLRPSPIVSKKCSASLSHASLPPAVWIWHRAIGETPGIIHSFLVWVQEGPGKHPKTEQTSTRRRLAPAGGDNGTTVTFRSSANLDASRIKSGTAAVRPVRDGFDLPSNSPTQTAKT